MSNRILSATLIVSIAAGFLVCRRAEASREQELIPDLPSATMEMSWTDMRRLLTATEEPADEEEKPPIDWGLASAEYDAEVLATGSVRIDGRFQIFMWKTKGWVEVPIIGQDVAPASVTLDGEPASLARTEHGTFAVLLDEPGVHALELAFFVGSGSEDGVASFSFACAPTAVTRMNLRIPARDAEVQSAAAANVTVERGETHLTADLTFRPSERIEVSWTLPAEILAKAQERPPEPPRIACRASTLLTLADRYLSGQSMLHYELLRGSTDTFLLHLPKEVNVLAVDGAGAGWSRVGEDDGQRIEVKVNHRIEDRYDFRLTYEMPVDEEAESVSIPELRAEDVVRQTGFIGIAVRGAVEVNPGGLEERLTRIDVSELPADVRAQSANPILLAYKYAEAGYELALDMRRLEDIEVRIAGIDHARLTTMITEEGTAVTRAEYRVRNNLKQFLRIELGPEVEIWGAEVGGQVVKPARETDSDTVLIPLSKSSVANRRMASFPVALVYMQRLERPMGWLRRVDLKTPSTDILANELEWRVMVPKEQFVYRATGDLDEERGRRRGEAALSREALGFEMETIRPLQEGVERFMITDINNAAASAGGGEKRYTEGPASGTARRPGDTVVAGVLPVSVRFPTEGTAHLYRRLLVSEGETSELRLYTCTKGLRTAARVLLFVLALGAGAALFRGLVRRQMTGRGDAARWVLLGLVLGLASLGAAAAWAGHSATALACVGMLVGLVAEGVRQWVTSSPRRDSDEIASGGEPGAAGDDGGVGE